ncbi:MAG TPA: HdeD family acid-resistance protein [Gemmatimonadales bacterium]|jgi:uncharacterized membrane protein HdeD (DUF308 family)|nr:HdeD family acid-resistance protein [Gemmatimonadales bacterium]
MARTTTARDSNDRPHEFAADLLAKVWWALALRGVAGILFGILAFVMPALTLAVLVLLFGAYALVDGIFNVVASLSGRSGARPWWALLLAGLVGIGAGLLTFFMPGLTALALAYLIGVWAIIIGVLEIISAVRLRKVITNEWWLGLSGVLAIVFGVLLTLAPGPGALAMVIWIGAYAFVYGVFLVLLGLRLRRRLRRA